MSSSPLFQEIYFTEPGQNIHQQPRGVTPSMFSHFAKKCCLLTSAVLLALFSVLSAKAQEAGAMEAPKTDFLFTTKAEATFRTSKATPLAVSPDNTAAFQAAIWDAARNAFVPTSHVAFTTACLDKGAAATVEVKEGRIVLTPNKEYLDQQAADVVVKVTYGVISTGTPDPTPGTGTFSVVLTADDDAPVSQAATVGGLKAAGPTDNGKSTSPVRRLRGETRRIATRAPANTAPVLTANAPQPWASDPVLESTPKTAAIADFVSVADDDQADMEAGFDYTFAVADESPRLALPRHPLGTPHHRP